MSKKNIISDLEFGKIPPQAIEAEESLLGCLISECERWYDIFSILKPESFYKEVHRKIYEAINLVMIEKKQCDLIIITEQLRKMNILEEIGGPFYVTQLMNKVTLTRYAQDYAELIRDKYIKRELIRYSTEINNLAYDDSLNTNELVEFAESGIYNITQNEEDKEATHIKESVQENIIEIEEAVMSEKHIIGIPTGSDKLNRLTNGWQNSDLIIIAARPAIGKSAFMLFFAKAAALNLNTLAIFSLEMAKKQLSNRLISSETDISPMILKSGRFEKYRLEEVIEKAKKLFKLNIYIDDTPALNIISIKSKAKKLKIRRKIKLIFIDYIQLMKGTPLTKGNREQEISEISRGLKELAKELDIPIIALAQLNRSVEMRSGDKRPQLSDLRESGSIEQDADMVIFIHRPEKYGIKTYEEGESTANTTELIVAKHRNGATGSALLYNNKSLTNISDFKDGELELQKDKNIPSPDKFIEKQKTIFDEYDEQEKMPF